ncbi:MAG TPA: hypothetical protein VHP83_07880, partial [Aggregatilineaceae bacterium]|nr:hypothetical protein [Aggregatilineaceae bacterium]
MSGGGFCEIHGPFDPPHMVCPYCALEQQDQQSYGPPKSGPNNEAATELGSLDALQPPQPPPP